MKGNTITIKKIPKKEEVENFWKGIQQNNTVFNDKAGWLDLLERTYCINITSTEYMIYRTLKGYAYGKECRHQHTHNVFVDDLKLYATNVNTVMKQLDIVTTFSKDIEMQFGEDKCA